MLNYQISFPKLVESAVSDKDGLRFNVLDLSSACDDISELGAVSQFASRELVRIDAGTSVWVMGKLLKFLAFVHGEGVSVRDLSGDNVLVHRERHYVLVFDFCSALLYPEGVPNGERCEDVSEAAKTVIGFLGGDPDGGTIPPDKELTDSRYEDTLRDLASGTVGDALKAHGEFYDLVDTIWERSFRPFTTHPL
jgi:serine/threonine protein kinase